MPPGSNRCPLLEELQVAPSLHLAGPPPFPGWSSLVPCAGCLTRKYCSATVLHGKSARPLWIWSRSQHRSGGDFSLSSPNRGRTKYDIDIYAYGAHPVIIVRRKSANTYPRWRAAGSSRCCATVYSFKDGTVSDGRIIGAIEPGRWRCLSPTKRPYGDRRNCAVLDFQAMGIGRLASGADNPGG